MKLVDGGIRRVIITLGANGSLLSIPRGNGACLAIFRREH